jgi:hypothetical protein
MNSGVKNLEQKVGKLFSMKGTIDAHLMSAMFLKERFQQAKAKTTGVSKGKVLVGKVEA